MAALLVEELTYPEGSPLPHDGSSEESDESSEDAASLVPSGETIPLRIRLPGESTFNRATPVTLEFTTDRDKQEAQIYDELEALFGIYGSRILSAFENGIKASDPEPQRTIGSQGQGEVTEGGSPAYAQLQGSYGRARDRLSELIRKELRTLQEAAKKSALTRLTDSTPEIAREAKRYLSGATDDATVSAILTSDAAHTELSGPDAPSMMQAMLEIQALMGQLEDAREGLPRAMAKGREDYVPIMQAMVWALGPTDEIVRAAAPAEARRLEELQNALANLLAVHCADYPILYRLVGQVSLPADVTYVLRPDGVRVAKSKNPTALIRFKDKVYQVLKESWQAVAELSDTIGKKPESVWHFPNVIRQTLIEQDIEPDSLVGRAADENVEKAAGVSLSSFLADGAGLVELIGLMVGAAPPVGAAVGVMATILSVPELMEIYKNTTLQRAAYRAVLDPNKSLASDESYVEFIFGLLSLLPVFGDLRTLRYAP